MTSAITTLEFKNIVGSYFELALIKINRPEQANSFSPEVIDGLIANFNDANANEKCRVIIITGAGKHFSAGADLNWMRSSSQLSHEENLVDAGRLTHLFETIYKSDKPTIAVVNGAAYGGAVGITACCDIAVATETAKFCLSEAKLGILPAVILPYLQRKMHPGQLKRLALTARVFNANEAQKFGLCEIATSTDQLDNVLREEIDLLLSTGPNAQSAIKSLFHLVHKNSLMQGPYTAEAIAQARVGHEAQSGFQAFFEKKATPWYTKLNEDWKFNG